MIGARLIGAVALALVNIISGCGFGNESGDTCRCVPDSDTVAFPHCAGVDFGDEVNPANPFATRQPACPSGQLLFLREPTTPEAVLFNIRDTFEGFSPVQYMDQLEETFLFVPDLTALSLYPEVYQAPGDYDPQADVDTLWTREDERRFITNLLDRSEFKRISAIRWYQAGEDLRILYDDDPARETYIFTYILELTRPPGDDGVTELLEVRGRAEVDMVTPSAENPVWSVRRWQDLRDPASTLRSMSEVRGEFSQ